MKAWVKISIDNIFFVAFYEDWVWVRLSFHHGNDEHLGWTCQGDNWLNGMFKKPKYEQTLIGNMKTAWLCWPIGCKRLKPHSRHSAPIRNIPFWFKKFLNSWIWGRRKFFKNWGQCLNYCEKNFMYLIHIKYMCFISEVLCTYVINFFFN